MIQRRDRTRFALEPFTELFAGYFDRDVPPQPRVPRAIHLAHPARADLRDDLIRSEFRACGKPHGKFSPVYLIKQRFVVESRCGITLRRISRVSVDAFASREVPSRWPLIPIKRT